MDFGGALGDTRSVEGCYIMPVGTPHYLRNSLSAALSIKLAAGGQYINHVLSNTRDHICTKMMDGSETIIIHSENLKFFINIVSLMGDYLAYYAGTDVMGHSVYSFCSFCGIRNRKNTSNSACVFACVLHFRRPSITRFDERMTIVKRENPSPAICSHLRITCLIKEQASSLIAVRM